MRLYFGGAETPTWRKHLAEAGVERVAVNFTHLRARLPKKKMWDWPFPENVSVLLWSTLDSKWSATEQDEYLEQWLAFCQEWGDRFDWVVEPELAGAAALRDDLWDLDRAGKLVVPWGGDPDALEDLARSHAAVAVTEDVLARHITRPLVTRYRRRHKTVFVGIGVGKADTIAHHDIDVVVNSTWISASRYGETILWDGAQLRRFPAKDKAEVRSRYRVAIARSGLNVDAILGDDKRELTALAIWSWRQLEESMVTRKRRTTAEDIDNTGEGVEDPNVEIDPSDPQNRLQGHGSSPVPVVRRETVPLPILALSEQTEYEEDAAGNKVDTGRTQAVLGIDTRASLRQCDSCYISGRCPGYEPAHTCAYDIPLEIRTKDQLVASMRAMLEIQGQRVLFARMAEELDGGFPTPVVSDELDRFLALVAKVKDITDNRDTLKLSLEAKGEVGVISRIFGAHAGEQARQLPAGGLDADQTDVLLGELIDER